ncbi:MAG: Ig-like domain-containing protein [Flavobacteriaceae bacterium]
MKKIFSNLVLLVAVGLLFIQCANRGTPSGGEKDVTPPVIVKSEPENYSTNFTAKEIKIYFDEYIKIKDLQKQLIISPPMDPEPEVTPLGSASKYITIKIFDTLTPNTTYAFNFGESIVDNNEGNPYPYYRYVFSTGSYIDSLQVNGRIEDALDQKPEEFVSVMLYEVDSTFTDSIIYKNKPKYITNTLDSTSTFQLDNLKAGKYLLVALKEENSNYTFQQKEEKIGFKKEFITVPTDTSYVLKLFKEITDFKAARPKLTSGNKIAFGFEGDAESMNINLLSEIPEGFENRIVKDTKSDSLYYFFNPDIESDSLVFQVSNKTYVDTFTVRTRVLEKDSLIVSAKSNLNLKLNEDFVFTANNPLVDLDKNKVSIMKKDSSLVDFSSTFETLTNSYTFKFDKQEENSYKIQMLPGALKDLFGAVNDTLDFNIRTRALSDYGNLRLILENAVYPVIVQLVSPQGEVKTELYSTKPEPLDFIHINPANYLIRVIYDANGNKKYDTGSYLKKIQPERVIYFPDLLEIRTNYDYIETFTLK